MKNLAQTIGPLLRGEVTAKSLARGVSPPRMGLSLCAVLVACGAFYGLCTGAWGVLRGTGDLGWHVLGVMLKVPLLFLLTLLVTVPSLYVFASLARIQLDARQVVRLMLASSALSLVVLASLGPVTVFFTFSSDSYQFIQLLNVAFFGIAGLAGVSYLGRNMTVENSKKVDAVVRLWFVLYAGVGLQMGWLLRPFIGDPSLPIELLRPTEGNVLSGILDALRFL